MVAHAQPLAASALEAAIPLGVLDWPAIESELAAYGSAVAPKLLSPETCRELAALYGDDKGFRSRIVMAAHGYGPGDYNCLHQDVYGEHLFPLQVAILLSEPGRDFTGGEFVLTEQRPRMQSRAEVVSLRQGDGVIFAVRERPVQGARGTYRVNLRHGVSRIKSGERFTLGIIFHDAA